MRTGNFTKLMMKDLVLSQIAKGSRMITQGFTGDEPTARRIVASVNACEGINITSLEKGIVKETAETLKSLLKALKADQEYYRTHTSPFDADRIGELMVDQVLAESKAEEILKRLGVLYE